MKKRNSKKNFIWNTIGTTIYTFNSLFFMIIVTRINGIKEAGIFTFAFSFACMIYVIGTYAGRTFQVTDRNNEFEDTDYIYHRIIMCLLMLLIGIVFIAIKNYTSLKIVVILLLILYRIFDAFSETLYAIFQKNDDLYKVGISLFLKSILSVITFLIVDYFTKNLVISIISVSVINIIIIIFYDYLNIKKYSAKLKKLNLEKIKKLFISGFFIFAFTFLSQYVINATKYAIDDIMPEEYQTIFGIILMPATLLSLCSQLILHPFLVNINSKLNNNDYKGFRNIIIKICLATLVIGILGEICCYFLGIPILNFIYSISLDNYLISLLIIIAGSVFLAMTSILSNALISIRKTKIQTVIYIIIAIFTTCISYTLVNKFDILGAAISYFLTMLLLFILYLIVFIKETKKIIK